MQSFPKQKKGLLYLLITGGEPFLWPDFWELYEYVSRKELFYVCCRHQERASYGNS